MSEPALLEMRGIEMTFAGVHALRGVDLTLTRGSVHALVGENGAGKSTLIKIMTGALSPTAGSIRLAGTPVAFKKPQDARAHGIVAAYQEVNVLPNRTIAENLFLGREPRRRPWGLIDGKRMNEDARALLATLGLELDPSAIVGALPIAMRQMVAIVRGVSLGDNVLVLDEPTSSLTATEIALLYDLIGRVKQRGTAIVYISHRLDEIYATCDSVTVLRDGRRVASSLLRGLDRLELVGQMLGKSPEELRRAGERDGTPSEPAPRSAPLLRATDLRREPALRGVTIEARPGEIVGLAGLLGSGRTETARAIFGADPLDGGRVEIGGTVLERHTPRDAIAAGAGFLAEDRGADGIVPHLSIRENLTLASLPSIAWFGIISRSREKKIVDELVRRLRIKASSAEQAIRELSGGNQQKVLLARWLSLDPRLLLVDEPTRGIDIGAKAEIHGILRELARQGMAIVLISSELEELESACSRVVVLRDGASVSELTGRDVDTNAIVHAIAEAPR